MNRFSLLALCSASVCLLAFSQPTYSFPATFTDLNEQLLFSSADAPPQPLPFTPGDCPDCPFEITNDTGTTWTDFHLEMRLGSGFGTFFFVPGAVGGYDGDVYEGPGVDALGDPPTALDIVGLNVEDGEVYSFNVDMDAFELQGTYELFGRPTVDGDGRIPEPATLALLTAMLAGMGVARFRPTYGGRGR